MVLLPSSRSNALSAFVELGAESPAAMKSCSNVVYGFRYFSTESVLIHVEVSGTWFPDVTTL